MEDMEVVGMAANTVTASESIEAAEQLAQLLISRTKQKDCKQLMLSY